MEFTTLVGDACYTPSESRKLVERINRLGFKVEEIRGVWMHHTHWKEKDGKAEEKLRLLLKGEDEGVELVKRQGMFSGYSFGCGCWFLVLGKVGRGRGGEGEGEGPVLESRE